MVPSSEKMRMVLEENLEVAFCRLRGIDEQLEFINFIVSEAPKLVLKMRQQCTLRN